MSRAQAAGRRGHSAVLVGPSALIAQMRGLQEVLGTALCHCLDLTGSQFGSSGITDAAGEAIDVVAPRTSPPAPAALASARECTWQRESEVRCSVPYRV